MLQIGNCAALKERKTATARFFKTIVIPLLSPGAANDLISHVFKKWSQSDPLLDAVAMRIVLSPSFIQPVAGSSNKMWAQPFLDVARRSFTLKQRKAIKTEDHFPHADHSRTRRRSLKIRWNVRNSRNKRVEKNNAYRDDLDHQKNLIRADPIVQNHVRLGAKIEIHIEAMGQ